LWTMGRTPPRIMPALSSCGSWHAGAAREATGVQGSTEGEASQARRAQDTPRSEEEETYRSGRGGDATGTAAAATVESDSTSSSSSSSSSSDSPSDSESRKKFGAAPSQLGPGITALTRTISCWTPKCRRYSWRRNKLLWLLLPPLLLLLLLKRKFNSTLRHSLPGAPRWEEINVPEGTYPGRRAPPDGQVGVASTSGAVA